MDEYDSPGPFQFSLRTLFIVVTIGAVFLAATRWLSSMAARSASQAACKNNLRQLGLPLLNYHTQYGHFPPACVVDPQGKPLRSWRVPLMVHLESQLLPIPRPDMPWNSPLNSSLANMSIAVYRCPEDSSPPQMTSYVAVVGPHTAWPGATWTKLSDFKDPSKTILLVEVANSGINWTQPRDLDVIQIAAAFNPRSATGVSSRHSGGINAVFADGHVDTLPGDIDPKKLAAMLEISSPDEVK